MRPIWALAGLACLVMPAFGACGINQKGSFEPTVDGGGGDAGVDADGSAGVGGGSCFPGSKVCPDPNGQLYCPKLETPTIGCLKETFCTPCISPHAKATCTDGHCAVDVCDTGFADCNKDPVDGCEANLQNDTAHCGACVTDCATVAGPGFICKAGQCVGNPCLAPATRDCNADIKDGCEVDTAIDPNNCGYCGNVCKLAHAQSACSGGVCTVTTCETGWLDCDGNPANGCEVNTAADKGNCGGCGHACDETNASAYCSFGVCVVVCAPGFGDCDGDAKNGCETDFGKDPLNCGSCGKKCSPAHVGKATCESGACSYEACTPGFGDCDGNRVNGCETNIYTDKNHCNGCPNVCPPVSGGMALCDDGVCGGACTGGVSLCGDHCANLGTEPGNCGACGQQCPAPPANAISTCSKGACAFQCNPGFDSCGTGGCIDLQSDLANCGKCGSGCSSPQGTTSACLAGTCHWTCPTGQLECGSGASAFCADPKNDPKNCGSCGYACPTPPNGSPSCVKGVCEFSCVSPALKCGGLCADVTSDPANCGECGVVCGNGKTCIAGSCVCPTSSPDVCDGQCTNVLTDAKHCSACDKPCSGGMACDNGVCACKPPTPDLCGATCTNKQTDPKNCLVCGVVCPATWKCAAGACKPP